MKNKKHKIFFLGNGGFAAKVLDELVKQKFDLELIVSEPDKKSGRGQNFEKVPVRLTADKLGLKLLIVNSKEELKNLIKRERPGLVLVSDFGWMIPDDIYQIPKFGFVVTHQSLLPKYRGTSPIQSVILNGESETGVSLVKMDDHVDHGPVLGQDKIYIDSSDNASGLSEKLSELAANLIISIIPKYLSNQITLQEQNHAQATYTSKFEKNDGQIDWTKSAIEIDRQVRALNIWPKASTTFRGKNFIIHAGQIIDNKYVPILVQLAGKKTISWKDFLNGQRLSESQALSELTAKL